MGVKPLAAPIEYNWWSKRKTDLIIENGLKEIPPKINYNIGASSVGMQFQNQPPPDTRATRARIIEQLLADHISCDIGFAESERQFKKQYLAGRSFMVLSDLVNSDGEATGANILFIDEATSENKRVAICLFGSAWNACGTDPEVPAWRKFGHYSSDDVGIPELIRAATLSDDADCPDELWRFTPDPSGQLYRSICWHAVNISIGQGEYRGDSPRPWHRGYTHGHYEDSEWLAQIYLTDTDLYVQGVHFDVVHVGAALWVRSGTPKAFVPYAPERIPELDARHLHRPLRLFAREWNRRHGRQRRHLI